MATIVSCPHPNELEQLAAGCLAPADVELLVQHLETCNSCLARVQALAPTDLLSEAVAEAKPVPLGPDEETVFHLMERLARLAEAKSSETSTQNIKQEESIAPEEEAWGFLAPAQRPDEIGRLGPYRILKMLGHGGMGMVFQAEDPNLKRLVALKVILPALAASSSARKRFLREARAAAAIKHDHIVRIFEVGEDRGVPFLTMEYLEGEPLDARLKREGTLTLIEVLAIGRQVAEALAAAHNCELIHRDIKPGNIWLESRGQETGVRSQETGVKSKDVSSLTLDSCLMTPDPCLLTPVRVKILDFGLARSTGDQSHLTRTGAIMGTPAYMAPEQAAGQKLDHRCDLFSLGCVLYRLCTGDLPFKGKNALTTLAALATTTPRPPQELNPLLPAELSDLIMRLLARNAGDRPSSAQQVAEALLACPVAAEAGSLSWPTSAAPNTAAQSITVVPTQYGPVRTPISTKKRAALAAGFLTVVAATIFFIVRTPSASDNDKKLDVPRPKDSPALQPATSDHALAFNGKGIIHIPSLKLDRSGPLTLEATVTIADLDPSQPLHLAGVPQQLSLFTGRTDGEDAHLSLGVQYETSFQHLADPALLPRKRRVHLAGVRDGKWARFFVDGKLVSSRQIEDPLLNASTDSFGIGNYGSFEGVIDEVRISSTARYDADFSPPGRFQPDEHTLALYHMDEGKGEEVTDSSRHKHHGSLQGDVRWIRGESAPSAPPR